MAAALRPEEHHTLPPGALALVQSALGQSLCGVYLLIAALGVGTLLCSACLPGRTATVAKEAESEERPLESLDGDLAAAASEL